MPPGKPRQEDAAAQGKGRRPLLEDDEEETSTGVASPFEEEDRTAVDPPRPLADEEDATVTQPIPRRKK